MQIAVISDTHDNLPKLDLALPWLSQADVVLHCGDLCSPFVIVRLGKGLAGKPLHIVLGNNDGDPRLLTLKTQEFDGVYLHGPFASLNLDGFRVAMNHYPEIARPIAASQQYDLVCYGHDHTANEEMVGNTLLLNPGEILGMNGRSSLAIFDTQSRKVRWVEV